MKVSADLEAKILELAGLADPLAPAPPPEQPEADFQADVMALAKRNGWTVYHTFSSRKSEAGFPDILAVRGQRLLLAELKTESGRLTAAQATWGELLSAVGGTVEYYEWRPSDFPSIVEALK